MKDEATGTLWVEKGRLRFRYDTHWLEQSGVMALSQSLPLQIEVFDDQVCRPFFAGLLPEGDLRRCGEPGSRGSRARASRGGMADSNAADHAAQDKLPVVVEGQRIGLPKGNAASTHILKPAIAAVDNSVTNEAFCMALAMMVKLRAADTQILMAGDQRILLVRRYDRRRANDGSWSRLHQEDFCQALAVPPDLKYQTEEGPDLQACFSLLRRATRPSAPEVIRLLDAVIFNALIGNHDAHAKNFSILYRKQATTLAPLYDLLCTAVYPTLTAPLGAIRQGSRVV